MNAEQRRVLEAEIRRRTEAGDFDGAMTAAIGGYGPELFGFLTGLSRDRDRANDAFGATCERLWRGLPAFRWESSFRVWAYATARNEFLRANQRAVARARREVPLSGTGPLEAVIARVRTATPTYERTDVKDAFARIRSELESDDHILLGLRLDRKMTWKQIACVLGKGDTSSIARESAALRKRFERLTDRLRERLRTAR